MKKNIAIFASGAGSNAQQIISYFKRSEEATVSLILSSDPQAGVLQIAKKEAVPTLIINQELLSDEKYLITELENKQIDLLVLAGFLKKIPGYLIRHYPDKIINIHPALLPKYGGKGMYGSRVHKAVLAAHEKESGITIHYVNDQYDEGKIILQKKCSVSPGDDVKKLAQKVHELEHKWYPIAIERILI